MFFTIVNNIDFTFRKYENTENGHLAHYDSFRGRESHITCCHTETEEADQLSAWRGRGRREEQVVGSVLGLMFCFARGFDPPMGRIFFPGRADFSLGVNMGSGSIPPKTLSDESINRGLICAHMHSIARTREILTFIS